MRSEYLDTLDDRLALGANLLGPSFARARAGFVRGRQMPDGGFAGRQGDSDIYYTDFALRTLALLEPDSETVRNTAAYVGGIRGRPATVAECFNRLNSARMLARAGINMEIDTAPVLDRLAETGTTAYDVFLAALCHEMLGTTFPNPEEATQSISDGLAGARDDVQTNDAAAAVGFLTMHNALDDSTAGTVIDAIASMQAPAGGFLAHCQAPEPDLLSTFTALVTLSTLGAFDRSDLAGAGRFVRSLADAGGFRACASDEETDVEYTWYGVAVVALLREYVAAPPGRGSATTSGHTGLRPGTPPSSDNG